MRAELYTRQYSGVLCSWLEVRGLDTGLIQDLPKLGYVIINDKNLVAAGFLRQCEGGHGILDSFITDPTAPAEERDNAMNLLFKSLIEQGKKLGLRQLMGFTVDAFTLSRAKRFGMTATSFTTLVLPLKGLK